MLRILNESERQLVSAKTDNFADQFTFKDLGLKKELLLALEECGYTQPTVIQKTAIPLILKNIDLLASSQTGTGKTASFALPIINRLIETSNNSTSPARHPIRSLILTPTRELADQVNENFIRYAKYTDLRFASIYGGIDIRTQVKLLQKGVEILTATPGRLLDHLEKKNIHLNQVEILVLDEADRMLDMGFIADLKKIITCLPHEKQTLCFSATVSPAIRELAGQYMHDYQFLDLAKTNMCSAVVDQYRLNVCRNSKETVLNSLINCYQISQAIIFCNSKQVTEQLVRFMQSKKFSAVAIHSEKTQADRMNALQSFKQGSISFLIATDVAARGLNIISLPVVINFDLPLSAADYVHRIGRTGRAGLSGKAFSLVQEHEYTRICEIENFVGKEMLLLSSISHPKNVGMMVKNKASGVFMKHNSQKVQDDPIFFSPYQPLNILCKKNDLLNAAVMLSENNTIYNNHAKLFHSRKQMKKNRHSQEAFLLRETKK